MVLIPLLFVGGEALLSRPRGRMPSEWRWAMDGPSARAVGQEGEPKEPDISRANKRGEDLWCYLPKESGSFQSHFAPA